MDQYNNTLHLLELLACPAFSVINGVVNEVNSKAQHLLISAGTDAESMVLTGKEDYRNLAEGSCLSLVVETEASQFCAYVHRQADRDLFLLDQDYNDPTQLALSMASCAFRTPLSRIINSADALRRANPDLDPQVEKYLNEVSKGAYQIFRLVANMSDVIPYTQRNPNTDGLDLVSVIGETVEKAAYLLEKKQIQLRFISSVTDGMTMGTREQVERALYNLILNAASYPAPNTPLEILVELKLVNGHFHVVVTDNGRGIPDDIFSTLFSRYRRVPTIENARYGIGLGLPLVRAVAANHQGTVLVERLRPTGTRVTMTLKQIPYNRKLVRQPLFYMDYLSEYDHALVELADLLPADLYNRR